MKFRPKLPFCLAGNKAPERRYVSCPVVHPKDFSPYVPSAAQRPSQVHPGSEPPSGQVVDPELVVGNEALCKSCAKQHNGWVMRLESKLIHGLKRSVLSACSICLSKIIN